MIIISAVEKASRECHHMDDVQRKKRTITLSDRKPEGPGKSPVLIYTKEPLERSKSGFYEYSFKSKDVPVDPIFCGFHDPPLPSKHTLTKSSSDHRKSTAMTEGHPLLASKSIKHLEDTRTTYMHTDMHTEIYIFRVCLPNLCFVLNALSDITLIKIRIFYNTLNEISMQELFIELFVCIKEQ